MLRSNYASFLLNFLNVVFVFIYFRPYLNLSLNVVFILKFLFIFIFVRLRVVSLNMVHLNTTLFTLFYRCFFLFVFLLGLKAQI